MNLLVDNKVIISDKKLADQLQQKGYGEREERKLVLDIKECLYLLEKSKLEVVDRKGKKMDDEAVIKAASQREKDFYTKYLVYRDLRERGYVTKTGYKFGFDFRVYPRGKKPGEEHTQWVIGVLPQDYRCSMAEFSRMVRLSGNLKTSMLVAVVDSENDINYYGINRVTP